MIINLLEFLSVEDLVTEAIQFYFLSQFKDKMLNSLGWGGSLQRDPSSAYI